MQLLDGFVGGVQVHQTDQLVAQLHRPLQTEAAVLAAREQRRELHAEVTAAAEEAALR